MSRVARLVDWAISLVSPQTAVVRQHYRRMENEPEYRETVFAMLRARGYRSAKGGKNSTPFGGGNGSADAETSADIPTLRSRAREINRDDPIGSGITGTMVREIVGTELRPQSKSGKKRVTNQVEAYFARRRPFLTPSEGVPFGQWQRMVAHKLLEDGEVFVKRTVTNNGPVWFETIEADRIATPSDPPAGSRIQDGIEKDALGRVVAYWVSKEHPGDNFKGQWKAADFVRVPADALRHMKLVERPGQTRGVTAFHAVLQDLRDLDLLLLACLKRTQVAACLAIFIKSDKGVQSILDATAENYGYQLEQDIVPGSIFKLWPGESIEQLNIGLNVPELETFVVMLCRRIGAALGVSWQTVLRDLSGSNYSSARSTILSDLKVVSILRKLITEVVLDWVWFSVLEDGVLRGELGGVSMDDLALVHWVGDALKWIDPLKEAQAIQLRLEMGLTCLRDVCAEFEGADWEEIQDQRLEEELREQTRREEMGLPPKVPAEGFDKGDVPAEDPDPANRDAGEVSAQAA